MNEEYDTHVDKVLHQNVWKKWQTWTVVIMLAGALIAVILGYGIV